MYANVRTYPHAILAARFHSGGSVGFLGSVKYEPKVTGKVTGIERVRLENQAVATLSLLIWAWSRSPKKAISMGKAQSLRA